MMTTRRNRVRYRCGTAALLALLPLTLDTRPAAQADKNIRLELLGTYASGLFNAAAAEIVTHDPSTQRLLVVNATTPSIDVLDIHDPASPSLLFSIDALPYGAQANSVAVRDGLIAVAIQATVKTDPGRVVFFDATGAALAAVTVGALPDMLTFSPNGRFVLVANEGEPNDSYTVDPFGSVSVINLDGGPAGLTQDDVTTVDFTAFNEVALDPSIRVFGPGSSVAQDLEPEYITVSHDSRTAWVTLQEANAIAELDIASRTFTRVVGLGFKDHSRPANALDPSDRDGGIRIATWPVFGMYQPDAIATLHDGADTFLVMVNEGDSREYSGFDENARVNSLTLDATAFPNGDALKVNAALGRLTVTNATGDVDDDGDMDRLYAFGGRSFSIRRTDGSLVFDSGRALEDITAAALPASFNATNDANDFDTRSDNKGPEPEGLTIARLFGRPYAFMALERIGGIVIYDLSTPAAPRFVQYVNPRKFGGSPAAGTAGDLGPEGVIVISEEDSPIGVPLLVVANEISGTTSLFRITSIP